MPNSLHPIFHNLKSFTMKNLQIIRQAISKGTIFLLLPIFFLPASCSKNEDEPIIEETEDEVDYGNLAAYFSGMERTLFVLPEHVESVLNTLGAEFTGTENLVMVYPNYDGDWLPTTFRMATVNSQELLVEIAINTRQTTEEILASDPMATLNPKDSHTNYNSTCVSVPEKFGTCHVIDNKSTATYKPRRWKCKPGGTERCTEYLEIGKSETRTYQNRNCSGDYTSVPTNEWICQ